MKRFPRVAKPRRSLLLASAFVTLFWVILIFGVGLSQLQPRNTSDIEIINKTPSLEVVSLQTTADGHLHLVLKNISSKAVNGYEVMVNGQARITTDTSIGDWAISPGSTHDLEFPADYVRSSITILAAMFADGSIDGDPAIVLEMTQWRTGLKRELGRTVLLLESALESHDVNAPEVLDKLESQLSSLAQETTTAQPDSVRGSRTAREDVIQAIDELRQRHRRNGTLMQRQRLLDLKERIERRIASL